MKRKENNLYAVNLHIAYETLKVHIKDRVFILGIAIGNEDGSDEMVVWHTDGKRIHIGISFIDKAFEEKKRLKKKYDPDTLIEIHETY
jgi:hypothetical protein